jgi:hypothetical protein
MNKAFLYHYFYRVSDASTTKLLPPLCRISGHQRRGLDTEHQLIVLINELCIVGCDTAVRLTLRKPRRLDNRQRPKRITGINRLMHAHLIKAQPSNYLLHHTTLPALTGNTKNRKYMG